VIELLFAPLIWLCCFIFCAATNRFKDGYAGTYAFVAIILTLALYGAYYSWGGK
jgi:hypothetical protein